jgi:hypothetical protein
VGFRLAPCGGNEARLWACADKVSNDLAAHVQDTKRHFPGFRRVFRNVLDRAQNHGPRQTNIYRMFRDEATVVEVWGSDRYSLAGDHR